MANLSAYIDFSVQFDLTGDKPIATLTDTGNYPSGVETSLKGNFLITQPDGATFGIKDWDNPNVKYNSDAGSLNAFEYSPRGACNGEIQKGTWLITYIIKATGYEDTVLKKTFYLGFENPEITIEPDFDVFTPELIYKDLTDYTVSGFSETVIRSWEVVIQDIRKTITGTSANILLQYNGDYYDSRYQATLKSTITYTNNTYSWLTVKTIITGNGVAKANTPISCKELMNQLLAFKDNDCGCKGSDKDYIVASMLLQAINNAMGGSRYDGLYENMVKYEEFVTKSIYIYINTGAKIEPYVYDCGHVTVINDGSTQVIGDDVLDFGVGDTGFPQQGDTQVVHEKLYNKKIGYFSKGNIFLSEKAGQYTYNRDVGNNKGKLSLLDGTFNKDERVMIGVSSLSTTSGGGVDGQTSYLHIKYSNDGGQTFTANDGKTPGDYIGRYNDFVEEDSMDVSDYTWQKVVGPPGDASTFIADSLNDL